MICFQTFQGGLKRIYRIQNCAGEVTFALVLRSYCLLKGHRIMQTPVVTLFAFTRDIQNDTHHETVMQQGNHMRTLRECYLVPQKGGQNIRYFWSSEKSAHTPIPNHNIMETSRRTDKIES